MTATQSLAVPADDSTPASALPVHIFRLRPDCSLRIQLPDDLTRKEVKRLHLFLKSVVGIDGTANAIDAEWPFSKNEKQGREIDWDALDETPDEDIDLDSDEDFLTEITDEDNKHTPLV